MTFTKKFKSIIYSIFGVVSSIISIRLLLLFLAVGSTPFVRFWMNFSYLFVGLWDGIYENIIIEKSVIEIYSLIAILFYLIFGILIERSIKNIANEDSKNIVSSIIDIIFKVIEFVLATRFFFRLFVASTDSLFVRIIYGLSNFIYAPFAGIIGDIVIDKVVIEISTLLILVIIIIIDVATENLVNSIFGSNREEISATKAK
jgi:hypothetical protein